MGTYRLTGVLILAIHITHTVGIYSEMVKLLTQTAVIHSVALALSVLDRGVTL